MAIPGHGLRVALGGKVVLIDGRLLQREGVAVGAMEAMADDLAAKGRTPVLVAVDGQSGQRSGAGDQVNHQMLPPSGRCMRKA